MDFLYIILSTVVVMSYNIRNGKAQDGDNSWELRRPATVKMLQTVRPDVFGVQEAYSYQNEFIAEQCPCYAFYGVGRDDGVAKGEHMSVFYNKETLEMLEYGTYWLSETPDVPSKGWDAACKRTATWLLLREKKSGRKFYFVNTHLDHIGEVARKEGLALIVKKIGEMNKEGHPVVLTGDFNVTPDNQGLAELDSIMKSARKYAVKSDSKASFQGFGLYDPSIIDYIYYSGFKNCKSFKVLDQNFVPGIKYISDHYPIVSKLTF